MHRAEYWQGFYKKRHAPLVPSQFAAFTLAEIPPAANIVEFGCGNGRDALFFARYGHRLIAVDKAQEAVDFGQSQAAREQLPVCFICAGVSALAQKTAFAQKLKAPLIFYSRFFLHSVEEREEAAFLDFCKTCLQQCEGKVFLEFRTDKDEKLYKKVADAHFRRFIKTEDFIRRAKAAGFALDYFIEGKGFAKYGEEDAHIARFILSLRTVAVPE